MTDISTGGGASIGGNVEAGKDVSGRDYSSTGRDFASQNVRINFGDIDPRDLQRIIDIVLGDGRRWRGVAGEIEKLEQSLTAKMIDMELRLEKKIEKLDQRMTHRPDVNIDNKILVSILGSILLLTVLITWLIWLVANRGGI